MATSGSLPFPAASAAGPDGFPWGWRPEPGHVLAAPVSLLRLNGPDRLRFLHGQTSQAIELAKPGQWLSTCCISPTARMRGLAEVLVDGDGAWLVIREGDGAAVRQALDRVLFPADAVQLGPLVDGLLLDPLASAAGIVGAPAATNGAAAWRPLAGAEGFWLADQLLLVGSVAPGDAPDLDPAARALLQRPRLDAAERERWRIQIGLPASPAELNDDTNPFELGLAGRVSLSKGCYVGQETLAKLATYDGVKRQLRRWFVPGSEGPQPGAVLLAAGERAGLVTSALCLPGDAGWIGLALVRRLALEAAVLTVEPEGAAPLLLELSQPDGFQAPPVGAGSAGSVGASAAG